MMRVWDQACDNTQDSEGVDLHVSSGVLHVGFIQSDEAVVLFVHI